MNVLMHRTRCILYMKEERKKESFVHGASERVRVRWSHEPCCFSKKTKAEKGGDIYRKRRDIGKEGKVSR